MIRSNLVRRHSSKKRKNSNKSLSPRRNSHVKSSLDKSGPQNLGQTKDSKNDTCSESHENGESVPVSQEDEKENKKKARKKRRDLIKKELEAKHEEEKRIRDEKLHEEEKIYEEQKRLEQEKENLRKEKMAELLLLNLGDYNEEDDCVEDSDNDDICSSSIDEDLEIYCSIYA